MRQYTPSDILSIIRGDLLYKEGNIITVTHAASLFEADTHSITWIKAGVANKLELIKSSKASVIICDKESMEEYTPQEGKAILIVENPKLAFIRIINTLFVKKYNAEIHPTAVIHPEAELDSSVYIGPHCIIGKCRIGAGTVIHGNCFIYDNTTIGKNVVINANTVIGSEGFGYSRNERGEFEHFPHIGGVILEDNVDIGSNTSIDRGALGNTIIKEGAKIDNLVHIAHNVVIGKHSAVIANAMIGGSTTIGDQTWIAPSTCIRDGIIIGNNTTVGLGALVTKNIPDNEVWAGFPAKKIR
jgi:UDP-3-O-[3-hydroxymyristoyl] glucosamine N-acyltransferase